MNIWVVIVVCACIMVAFLGYSSSLSDTLEELNAAHDDSQLRLSALQNEQAELQETIAVADTDAFIENQARTKHGYMMPDEIRFVISDPEVLYGDEEVPSP